MTTTGKPTSAWSAGAGTSAQFAATRWSMVLAATQQPATTQKPKPGSARRALEELCQTYWYPLYAYVRRRGVSAPDAQDVVQGFFARLLEKGDLAQVDRAKGRFRSFLLASINHFLANHWAAQRAAKRGGGRLISLGALDPEARYRIEPADTQTPERLFDRQWALTVLEQVLRRLREEYQTGGRGELFDALKPALTGDDVAEGSAEIAGKLGMKPASLRVAAHRLRKRYRQLLCAEIGQTVANPDQIDAEIRQLMASL